MIDKSKSTFELINELIIAISHILWPILALVIIFTFKKEISSLLNRLRKGKFLGQELELNNEIDKFKDLTEKAQKSVGGENDQEEIKNSKGDEILSKSIEDPTIGIIMLSREIEKEIINITASLGLLSKIENKPITYRFQVLVESKYLAESILNSVKIFWDLRSKIVHGKTIEDEKQIIRVLEIGTTLLDTLKNIPRAKYSVYKKDVDLYSDSQCLTKRNDVKGIILETISPEGIHISYNLRPTTKNFYNEKDLVAWEWSFDNIWNRTFYKDPDTDRIIKAFDSSAEFVGRPIHSI